MEPLSLAPRARQLRLASVVVVSLAACQREPPPRAALPLELVSARGVIFDPYARQPPSGYDPLALAAASIGKIANPAANIPPPCYTRTGGASNPCWACHTRSQYPNLADDWELQQNYPFIPDAITNHWKNLFRDRTALVARFRDADLAAYIATDNFGPLRAALAARRDFAGWSPDVDLAAGFDGDGFAADGTGWRAIRYKPFPGTFWPTNGSADDVYVRLPAAFRRDAQGRPSRAVYQTNLAILEAAIAGDPRAGDAELVRAIEPIDERAGGVDLDRDGQLGTATVVAGLPATYAGGAASVAVLRALYPAGTELLHTVRYLDPDAPGFAARRMKEVRYARKEEVLGRQQIFDGYARVELASDTLPYGGDPVVGLTNPLGWRLQGWIEDAGGWLRLQTHEEQLACMGCHTNLGVTIDQTFALARKVPGRDGWRVQDVRGIPDRPQVGHREGEYALYLERVGGGDDLRGNAEVLAHYFRAGTLDRAAAAALGPDIAPLVLPSRARAFALDRAYLANVLEQSYVWGRDAVSAPAKNVEPRIIERSTGIGEAGRTVRDGRLHLDW